MRLARVVRSAVVVSVLAGPALAETIVSATYAQPTTRYAHGILGDAIEWGALQIEATISEDGTGSSQTWEVILPEDRVFEDVAPRLWDVTGDGRPEIVVVVSRLDLGASLVVLGMVDGAPALIAATPHIGQTNRWLAPVGAADLDGDGLIEIAYIDRPHLARTLRVWRFENGALNEVAAMVGLTNHRIGETDIGGGLRDCGQGPEMIVASADWSRLVAVRMEATGLEARDIGPHRDRRSFAAALSCAG